MYVPVCLFLIPCVLKGVVEAQMFSVQLHHVLLLVILREAVGTGLDDLGLLSRPVTGQVGGVDHVEVGERTVDIYGRGDLKETTH